MELKLVRGIEAGQDSFCFNRTFMELKPDKTLLSGLGSYRFNRTFMELKLREMRPRNDKGNVLIGPSWN